MNDNKKFILAGVISSPHGIKGHVKIHSYTSPPSAIADYNNLYDDNQNAVKISLKSIKNNVIIAAISGINERNMAENIVGTELFISRSDMENTDENEYYHSDLIGLDVRNANNKKFATIQNIHNFGAGDIVEIIITDSNKSQMHPFTKDIVPIIDIENGFVVIDI